MAKTITKKDRLALVGLLELAKRHNAMLRDILKAAITITGEDDDLGHTADAVYSDYDADALLKQLGLSVK